MDRKRLEVLDDGVLAIIIGLEKALGGRATFRNANPVRRIAAPKEDQRG